MPKKKNLPEKVLDACQVLDDFGANKEDVAKAVKVHPTTLKRRMKEREVNELRRENEQLRAENAMLKASEPKKDNLIELKKKKA